MTTESLYSFPARMESLDAMVVHLRSITHLPDSLAVLRAGTALEELLTNSVVHGVAHNAPASEIWLSAALRGHDLQLRYEDAFAPFDPISEIDRALRRTANPMEHRPPGGLGLLIVFRMADEFSYQRENGRNRIDMSFIESRIG